MRDYKLYLEDIAQAILKIEKYSKGMTLIKLQKNDLVVDGIVRNLEIIGDGQISYTAILVLFIGWFYFEHTPKDFVIDFQHRYSISNFEVRNFKGKVTDSVIFGYGNVTT